MLVLQEESAAGSTAVQGRARRLVAGGSRTGSGLPMASVCFPISEPAPLRQPPPWCRLQALPFPVWLVRQILMKHTFKGQCSPQLPMLSPHAPPPFNFSVQPARVACSSQSPPRGPAQRLHTRLCAPTRLPSYPSPRTGSCSGAISSLLLLTAAPGARTVGHPSCTDGETRPLQLGHFSRSLSSKALAPESCP